MKRIWYDRGASAVAKAPRADELPAWRWRPVTPRWFEAPSTDVSQWVERLNLPNAQAGLDLLAMPNVDPWMPLSTAPTWSRTQEVR